MPKTTKTSKHKSEVVKSQKIAKKADHKPASISKYAKLLGKLGGRPSGKTTI